MNEERSNKRYSRLCKYETNFVPKKATLCCRKKSFNAEDFMHHEIFCIETDKSKTFSMSASIGTSPLIFFRPGDSSSWLEWQITKKVSPPAPTQANQMRETIEEEETN